MRYVLLGVGRQGLAAVHDLITHCEATELLAIDSRFRSADQRRQTQSLLEQLLGDRSGHIHLEHFDITSRRQRSKLAKQAEGFDCLLSALPYALNLHACELAIAAALPICDMGGNPTMVERQKQLAEQHNHVQ